MSIIFDSEKKFFHLKNDKISYAIGLLDGKIPVNLYWGKKVDDLNVESLIYTETRPFSVFHTSDRICNPYSLELEPVECPTFGSSDYRTPMLDLLFNNGSRQFDLVYIGHDIKAGKPKLKGLPATYCESDAEAETLELYLEDKVTKVKITLLYTIFKDYSIIARSARVENNSNEAVKLMSALSASVDMIGKDFDVVTLNGAWGRERHLARRPIDYGITAIDSKRGASSHNHNPFIAICDKNATEINGQVYAMNLIYSGSFKAQIEVNAYDLTRMMIGINDFDFEANLAPGEDFQTPEAVLAYSDSGFGELSRNMHKLYRTRLCRGKHRDAERPVLINNWEATYFSFDEEKIVDIATAAKDIGIELMVMDDGWFGKRDQDNCSLGDWYTHKTKLPQGLDHLVKRVNDLGMKFGIWFEPEMVNPDSDLYRAHPDWCIHIEGRERLESRQQLLLDLSKKEVCDYLFDALSKIFSSTNIAYVKWDFNRNSANVGSLEQGHKYILGLYDLLERLTSAFPDILFESCSGGGGRYDAGMLYYMPQTWTSDDTDGAERLKIQYGTSMAYPLSSMGAHVSAVPNHQVGRTTPLKFRSEVAAFGNYGYELDLTQVSAEDKEQMTEFVAFVKKYRRLFHTGDLYRLVSPFENELKTASMVVSEDKNTAIVAVYIIKAQPNSAYSRIRLQGLDPNKKYMDEKTGKVYGGDQLMNVGLVDISGLQHDYESRLTVLRAVE